MTVPRSTSSTTNNPETTTSRPTSRPSPPTLRSSSMGDSGSVTAWGTTTPEELELVRYQSQSNTKSAQEQWQEDVASALEASNKKLASALESLDAMKTQLEESEKSVSTLKDENETITKEKSDLEDKMGQLNVEFESFKKLITDKESALEAAINEREGLGKNLKDAISQVKAKEVALRGSQKESAELAAKAERAEVELDQLKQQIENQVSTEDGPPYRRETGEIPEVKKTSLQRSLATLSAPFFDAKEFIKELDAIAARNQQSRREIDGVLEMLHNLRVG